MGLKDPSKLELERCWVARKWCGCMVGAIIDQPRHQKEIDKQLANWRDNGLTIEQTTVGVVWKEVTGWKCPHTVKQQELL